MLWVAGEVSGFVRHGSGHCYFTLKDRDAQVGCVMFRQRALQLGALPRERRCASRCWRFVTLYEPRGQFQLNVETLRRGGLGTLFEAFERLKAKLKGEGLFDAARKRSPPPLPRAVGVVTSRDGAALRDFLTTLARRMPGIAVRVYPTPVQGEGAAARIAAALRTAGERLECDVLVVCRGGGSIEDLWAFNDEAVARAIVASPLPGRHRYRSRDRLHHRRFRGRPARADTDRRRGAGESEPCWNSRSVWTSTGSGSRGPCGGGSNNACSTSTISAAVSCRPLNCCGTGARRRATSRAGCEPPWRAPARRVPIDRAGRTTSWCRPARYRGLWGRASTALRHRLAIATHRGLERRGDGVGRLSAQLAHLNPAAVLARGYSITRREDGRIVRAAAEVAMDERLSLTFAAGGAWVRVEEQSGP